MSERKGTPGRFHFTTGGIKKEKVFHVVHKPFVSFQLMYKLLFSHSGKLIGCEVEPNFGGQADIQ
jgi:hypothetical protein